LVHLLRGIAQRAAHQCRFTYPPGTLGPNVRSGLAKGHVEWATKCMHGVCSEVKSTSLTPCCTTSCVGRCDLKPPCGCDTGNGLKVLDQDLALGRSISQGCHGAFLFCQTSPSRRLWMTRHGPTQTPRRSPLLDSHYSHYKSAAQVAPDPTSAGDAIAKGVSSANRCPFGWERTRGKTA
jgi:hypothetical protein